MQTLLRSFLFFVLLTKGNSLECETCTDVGTSCMGRMKTCVEGQDTCIVVFLESIIDGKVLQTVVKGCASSEKCSYPPKHMTIGKGKSIRTSLSCCTGSDCASIVPPRSQQINPKANGKQCPSCYSWSGTCNADMVNCSGPERFCFDVLSRSKTGGEFRDIIMKGCTIKSTCAAMNKGIPPILEEKDTIVVNARCTPDPSRGSRSSGLYLPIFSGLLFLQIPW
ncbi:phospholipase A2 inhibitor NAI-like isoform X3 [Podarcis raffonei]|uniref:phospholipase A2 inhibitor NAI-like isoform X3 n=1 Tax=Podarcis raffonei TaxID=65483 RepID=UPI0023295007|nr:phospholipase A2 inhibitor NAI-like isoform X3 [Podarcis raffonei]